MSIRIRNLRIYIFFSPDPSLAWTGLNDITTESEYLWSDGRNATFVNWFQGKLQANSTNEDCVAIGGGNLTNRETWKVTNCDVKLHFVCEKIST